MSASHDWKDTINHGWCTWYACKRCGCQKRSADDDGTSYFTAKEGAHVMYEPACVDAVAEADAEQLDIGKLLTYWEAMLPNERQALLAIARRLYWGQREYGPLKFGKKDWAKEAQEEAFDMAVYLAASLTLKEEK